MKRKPAAAHISTGKQPEIRDELARNLLGTGDHSLVQLAGRNKRLHDQAVALGRALLANGGADVPVKAARAALDPFALRGLPAVGGRGSLGGAIPGTRPDRALIAKETRREQGRR